MRFALSVLPFLAAFACGTVTEPVPVQAVPDAQARFVGPDQFANPDCMWPFIDEVDAIVADFRQLYRAQRDDYQRWYQDARANGASQQELDEILALYEEATASLLEELYATLAAFEDDVCGVDPCQDPSDPNCCPYVGPDGQCYDDYCAAYPDDPQCQVWCDNPDDPACFCEYEPDHPDCQDCDVNGDGVCDDCDVAPDLCDPPVDYCDLYPNDPNCWQGCDPNDIDCICQLDPELPDCQPVEPPCDPATGDCCDPADPNCVR